MRLTPVLAASVLSLVAGCASATSGDLPAAGEVVDCRSWGGGGHQDVEVYAEGATADSPEGALEVAAGEGLVDGMDDLLVAAQTEDRVLYVLEVQGVVKQAVVVRDGPATEGAGGPGWYVESWARCDPAELPASYTEPRGLLLWEDAATGEPAPTTEIQGYRGPEHCDWESMTFLEVGDAVYVRRPDPELFPDFFAEDWRPSTELPADAVDTGFQRQGEHLWLSPDRRRAYVGSEDDVELWPRTTQRLGCA